MYYQNVLLWPANYSGGSLLVNNVSGLRWNWSEYVQSLGERHGSDCTEWPVWSYPRELYRTLQIFSGRPLGGTERDKGKVCLSKNVVSIKSN